VDPGDGVRHLTGGRGLLKITLKDVSKPPVWRRVLVPAGVSLGLLHEVIRLAMGWDGGHLHMFSHGGSNDGPTDLDLDPDPEDADEVLLDDLLDEPGDKLSYTYDFGDDWAHEIRLEKILPADSVTAPLTCLTGKGACPPETAAEPGRTPPSRRPSPTLVVSDCGYVEAVRSGTAVHSTRFTGPRESPGSVRDN